MQTAGNGHWRAHQMLASSGDKNHGIVSGVTNTRLTHRVKERSLQRTLMRVIAVPSRPALSLFGLSPFLRGVPCRCIGGNCRGSRRLLAPGLGHHAGCRPKTGANSSLQRHQTGGQGRRLCRRRRLFHASVLQRRRLQGHVYAVEPTAFFKYQHFVKAVAELQGYAVTTSKCNGYDCRRARRTKVPREARPVLDFPKLPRPT